MTSAHHLEEKEGSEFVTVTCSQMSTMNKQNLKPDTTQKQKQTKTTTTNKSKIISYQNPVAIHDCIQSVGNGQDSAIRELVTYCLLNYGISPAREESQPYLTSNGSWPASHTGYDKVDVKST